MLLFISLLSIFIHSITADDPNCPFSYTYNNEFDLCLTKPRSIYSWNYASKDCSNDGGNLLSIHNAFQNSLAALMIWDAEFGSDGTGSWLGAVQSTNGTWSWMDGSPFDYQRFSQSDPPNENNACVYLDTFRHVWVLSECNGYPHPYICSHPVVTSTTTDPYVSPHPPTDLNCLPANQQAFYNCQKGWVYSSETGYQYKVIYDRDFDEGEAACVSEGGHLVSIHSDVESRFVTGLCCASNCYYDSHRGLGSFYATGGYKKGNDTFMWTDGSPYDYQGELCLGQPEYPSEPVIEIFNYDDTCAMCGKPVGIWWVGSRTGYAPYLVCKKR